MANEETVCRCLHPEEETMCTHDKSLRRMALVAVFALFTTVVTACGTLVGAGVGAGGGAAVGAATGHDPGKSAAIGAGVGAAGGALYDIFH